LLRLPEPMPRRVPALALVSVRRARRVMLGSIELWRDRWRMPLPNLRPSARNQALSVPGMHPPEKSRRPSPPWLNKRARRKRQPWVTGACAPAPRPRAMAAVHRSRCRRTPSPSRTSRACSACPPAAGPHPQLTQPRHGKVQRRSEAVCPQAAGVLLWRRPRESSLHDLPEIGELQVIGASRSHAFSSGARSRRVGAVTVLV
jgi:hypothetical protein